MPPTEKRNLGSYEDSVFTEAIKTLISECASALRFANALGGARTDKWDVIHNYKIEEIMAEAKKRGLLVPGITSAVGKTIKIEDSWAKSYLT